MSDQSTAPAADPVNDTAAANDTAAVEGAPPVILVTNDGEVETVTPHLSFQDAMAAVRENFGLGYDDITDADLAGEIERSQGVSVHIHELTA